MSKYAYAVVDSFKEPLMVFPKGTSLSPDASGINKDDSHTILMSRTDFTVKVVEVPPLPDDQLRPMLAYRIKSLHPGDPARTVFDYQLITRDENRFAVLFITRQAVRDSYRHLGEKNLFILPFHLMKRDILKNTAPEAYFLFWHRHWIDIFAVRNGRPDASYVIRRTTALKSDLNKIMKLLAPADDAAPFTHYCAGEESSNLRERFSAAGRLHQARYITFDDLFQYDIPGRETVFLNRHPLTLPPLKRRLLIYGVAVALLAVVLIFRISGHLHAYRDKLATIETSLTEKNKDLAARLKEMRNLEAEYQGLRRGKPVDLYRLLSELAAVFPADMSVQSIVVKGNVFQLEGTGYQPLQVEEKLNENPLFSDIKVSEMKPLPGSGRQAFRMKGVFSNEKTQ